MLYCRKGDDHPMKKLTIGILAHVDSGKTTLSEAMLYTSGTIKKLGRVDRKDAFLDTFSLEKERGITIFSKLAQLTYNDTEITLADTPGHADFSAETERSLQILDYAILVISATDGVQSHTITLWKLLSKYNIPCFIFINKTDLTGADVKYTIQELKNRLSDSCIDFSCVGTQEFNEEAAMCDETLFEKYDKTGSIEKSDICSSIKNRNIFPCMYGSALRLSGIEEFMKTLCGYTSGNSYKSEFGAKVYKIMTDESGSRLTFMKITGGSLKVKDIISYKDKEQTEKVNQIRIYSGKKFTAVSEVSAGTVCAVTGLTLTRAGEGLGSENDSFMPLLVPVLSYTVEFPEGTDKNTAFSQMKILEAEDPSLNVSRDMHRGNIQINLMGEIQLEILKRLISDRFGMNVSFSKPSIIYKETITETAEGVGHFEPLRHYAEVHFILRPGKRNSGLIFKTECREDKLDRNWQRLILTHLYEKVHIGVLTGSPITDIEITLTSGKAHLKHTEGGDFRQAVYRAVRHGLRYAKSILLEPIYSFTLEIPAENAGRAITDIQRMEGTFNTPETVENTTIITGTAPVSEMNGYISEVISYTKGRGRLTCTMGGYAPCHNSEEVIASFGYDPDADTDNPCDSVFCSHGAGHIVKWDKVYENMHLESTLAPTKHETVTPQNISKYKSQKDIFALDKELMEIFERTYGPIKRRQVAERKEYNYSKEPTKATKKVYSGTDYLLVDGYNVIFSWDELKALAKESIDSARNRLINILCNYRGYKKCELILVFDAYNVPGHDREVEKIGGISVVYTKQAETADMYIEKASHKLAKDNRVRVVTSDGLEQIIILGAGALRVSSPQFLNEVKQAENEIREYLRSADNSQ